MAWYPCCCDQGNTIYVPCCLHGIQAIVECRTDEGSIRMTEAFLTHLPRAATSVNHWSPMAISTVWEPYSLGGTDWYHWGLGPVTPEDVFLAAAGGNWKLQIKFRNVSAGYDYINNVSVPSRVQIRSIRLRFSFWVNSDYQYFVDLHPASLTGSGWTNLSNLTNPQASPVAESVLLGNCNSAAPIMATFAEARWQDVRHVIDNISQPYRAYKFDNPLSGNPADDQYLCFKALKQTLEPTTNNVTQEAITNCESVICNPDCDCLGSRLPLSISPPISTCQDCRCTTNTPIKLGGYGSTYPDPPVYTWPQVITGDEWTIRGFAKWWKGDTNEQVLLWHGSECFAAPPSVPIFSFALVRWALFNQWFLKIRMPGANVGIFSYISDTTVRDQWFFWWIRKKKIGETQLFEYTFGVRNADNRMQPLNESVYAPGISTILGEDGEGFSLVSNIDNSSSFAGCVDGLTFNPYAELDYFLDSIKNGGCTIGA